MFKPPLFTVSWPRSGVHHISQWLLESFCEHLHWWHGNCLRCSVTFGSISSQRPASFFLALLSRSMTHRRTEIWKWQGSALVSPVIQEMCCYLSILASAMSEPQWLMQSFRFWAFIWNDCCQKIEACHCCKLLFSNLDLPLYAIGAICQ